MPSQKRKSASSHDAPANKKPKPSPSKIVGGLNGDYRVTGDESTAAFHSFTIPSGKDDKVIPCQERQPSPKSLGQHDEQPILVFTHGAGGGLENPATKLFADGYGASSRVVCFQGTMNLQSRVRNFAAVLDHLRAHSHSPKQEAAVTVAVGGRSMGARAAVMVAMERAEVKRLVLVSYPLTGQGGDVRDRILLDLPADKEVLFLVGSEDAMCGVEELAEVRGKMKAESWVVVVRGADHGMSLKLTGRGLGKAEQERIVEGVRRWSGRVAAEWVSGVTAVKDGEVIDWEELDGQDEGEEEKGKEDDGDDGEEKKETRKQKNTKTKAVDEESSATVEKGETKGSRRSKRTKK